MRNDRWPPHPAAYYSDPYGEAVTADEVLESGEPEAIFTGVLDPYGRRIMRRSRERVAFGFVPRA